MVDHGKMTFIIACMYVQKYSVGKVFKLNGQTEFKGCGKGLNNLQTS
jgi:hypothetical protein